MGSCSPGLQAAICLQGRDNAGNAEAAGCRPKPLEQTALGVDYGAGDHWRLGPFGTMRENPESCCLTRVANQRGLPMSRTSWANHGIMTVWGKPAQAASELRALKWCPALRANGRDRPVLPAGLQSCGKHCLAVFLLSIRGQCNHASTCVARLGLRDADTACRFQTVHHRHLYVHQHDRRENL